MTRKKKLRYAMSLRRKNAILAAFFLLVLPLLVFVDRRNSEPVRSAVKRYFYAGPDRQKYHERKYRVAEVIDGDTVDLDIPDGKYDHTRVRLLGVDTPETKDPRQKEVMYFGPEASEYTTSLCLNKPVTVLLDTVSKERDRYGRLLAYLRLDDGRVINEELVRNGLGYADSRFDHSFFDKYAKLQKEAIRTKTGLWKEITKDKAPTWVKKEWVELMQQTN